MKSLELKKISGKGLRVLVVHTRWNSEIVNELVSLCLETLRESGCEVVVKDVPGCYELPFACQTLLASTTESFDGAVAIGLLIKGQTMHFEYISTATTSGLMQAQLELRKPIVFGVLTCLTEEQAKARIQHAKEWALTAIEMCLLKGCTK